MGDLPLNFYKIFLWSVNLEPDFWYFERHLDEIQQKNFFGSNKSWVRMLVPRMENIKNLRKHLIKTEKKKKRFLTLLLVRDTG